MNIQDAIRVVLNGDAILFAGAGFSSGAQNQNSQNFKRAKDLCKLLCNEINIEYDDDLGYVSEKFQELKGDAKLIELLQSEYIASMVSHSHEQLMEVKWKRVYTTNYDDIIEKASANVGNYRIPITLGKDAHSFIKKNNLVVHLNGYIKDLTPENLYTEFKLSSLSYLNEDFKKSDWLSLFRQDIKNARAVFFIGYSLNYDIDIQRILIQNSEIKDKCFFITNESITTKSKDVMGRFGKIVNIGVDGFANELSIIKKTFIPAETVDDMFYSFRHYKKEELGMNNIKDEEIFDLFIKGRINLNHVRNYSCQKKYFVERNELNRILTALESGIQFAILHSDLGNGKTCMVYSLISKLIDKGHVFKFEKLTESFDKELELIANYDMKKYIIIEDYNLYLKAIKNLRLYRSNNMYFIFTARSLINDVFYLQLVSDLKLQEDEIGIYEINKITDKELKDLIEIFDEYNLWGKDATYPQSVKFKMLKRYNNRFQNILVEILESEYIGNEVSKIVSTITSNPVIEEIILLSFINDILSLNMELDDIIYLLDNVLITAKITKNPAIGELINVEQNKIAVKSSILSNYILKKYNFSVKIIDILIKVMKNADTMRLDYRYSQLMKMLVSFSNIRLILKDKDHNFINNVIKYYENVKNMEFNKENPYFWLQYAIARLDLKHFEPAKIYFENAYAFGKNRRQFDTFQIDTHYSRYLLEKQIFEGTSEEAFTVFKKAHELIIGNRNKPENFHYPLRQTKYYYDFYLKYFNGFDSSEKAIFILCCKQILDKIQAYIDAIRRLNRH